jgi:glycosyltransferase involved in cell wall biosynthesis
VKGSQTDTVPVSFVLPVFNGAKTLEGCLRSLQGLTLHEWECIAVDDASTDGSSAILEAMVHRDSRFRVLRHFSNRGVGAARATGLASAVGESIHFLDQDDHLSPQGIERLFAAVSHDGNAAGVFGHFLAVHADSGRRYQWQSYPATLGFSDLIERSPFTFLSVLHRRALVVEVGGMALGIDGCDEWDLWGRLTRTGHPLRYCNTAVGEYRIHGENASFNAERLLLSGLRVLDVLHGPDPRVPSPAPEWRAGAAPAGKRRRQSRFHWLQTANCLARRDVRGALRLIEVFEKTVGLSPPELHDGNDLHTGMKYGCMLAGSDPVDYLNTLRGTLENYFRELESRFERPGLTDEALRNLERCSATELIAENRRLHSLVEGYRSSRSYRIGRVMTRSARALLDLIRR